MLCVSSVVCCVLVLLCVVCELSCIMRSLVCASCWSGMCRVVSWCILTSWQQLCALIVLFVFLSLLRSCTVDCVAFVCMILFVFVWPCVCMTCGLVRASYCWLLCMILLVVVSPSVYFNAPCRAHMYLEEQMNVLLQLFRCVGPGEQEPRQNPLSPLVAAFLS